jgi:hypothetical protein
MNPQVLMNTARTLVADDEGLLAKDIAPGATAPRVEANTLPPWK